MTKLKWKEFSFDEPKTYPAIQGMYRILVHFPEERDGPHVIFAEQTYESFGTFKIDESSGGATFEGIDGNDGESIYAYYGPLEFPPCPKELLP